MPRLSIIVPVYNVEKYIAKCLDSILRQSFLDMEVICVNDGSTDRSLEILTAYAKKDGRIRVFNQKNSGLGATRNVGICHATGDYIGFVDSDDFIAPRMYEALLNKAEEYDSDIVICNVFLYDMRYGSVWLFRDDWYYEYMDQLGVFSATECPKVYQFIGVWDRIYKRKLLEKYNLRNPEKRIYEDVLFTVQTLTLAEKISVVNQPFYCYRTNRDGSIVNKEVVEDSYKFDFLKNLYESKAFLQAQGKYLSVCKEFLAFQLTGILFHQKNMQTNSSFLRFMRELRDIVDDADIACMKSSTAWRPALIYLWLLKKQYFCSTLILLAIGKRVRKMLRFFRLI